MKKIVSILAALAFVFSSIPQANAAIISSFPYNLTNGSLADATQVMGNFNEILNDVNNNAAHSGANSDITSLTGLTTALANTYGGTNVYTGGTVTGTADALVIATTVPSNFILAAGKIVTGVASVDCDGSAVTLNAHSTGATAVKDITEAGLVDPPQGAIVTGGAYAFYYDGTRYIVLNPTLPANLVTNASTVGDNNEIAVFNGSATDISDSGINASDVAVVNETNIFTQPQIGVTESANDSSTRFATTAFVNPANSIATSGYQKLASGLIIQWGTSAGLAAGGDGTVTFPLAFPTTCFSVEATLTVIGADKPAIVTSKSKPSFVWHNGSTNPTETVYYVAIGN